jgi:serine/threonine protein kinase
VEQLHKIFKLCGSPSEEYWRKSKLPHATIFKPQQPYERRVNETFKDFPLQALALVDLLLSVEPADRGTASSALNSQVCGVMHSVHICARKEVQNQYQFHTILFWCHIQDEVEILAELLIAIWLCCLGNV